MKTILIDWLLRSVSRFRSASECSLESLSDSDNCRTNCSDSESDIEMEVSTYTDTKRRGKGSSHSDSIYMLWWSGHSCNLLSSSFPYLFPFHFFLPFSSSFFFFLIDPLEHLSISIKTCFWSWKKWSNIRD